MSGSPNWAGYCLGEVYLVTAVVTRLGGVCDLALPCHVSGLFYMLSHPVYPAFAFVFCPVLVYALFSPNARWRFSSSWSPPPHLCTHSPLWASRVLGGPGCSPVLGAPVAFCLLQGGLAVPWVLSLALVGFASGLMN